MRVAIHQPQYLPWIPYFDKADRVDIFVFLDNVQYQKNGVQNRNMIKTANGSHYLTVPVKSSLQKTIAETELVNNGWQKKHIRAIEQSYTKAKALSLFSNNIKPVLENSWRNLASLNIALTKILFRLFGITCKTLIASELGVTGSKQQLVIDICKCVGAAEYLSGTGAIAYHSEDEFSRNGINLVYQKYKHPVYTQLHQKHGFIQELSAIDLLLNEGNEALQVLRRGREQ